MDGFKRLTRMIYDPFRTAGTRVATATGSRGKERRVHHPQKRGNAATPIRGQTESMRVELSKLKQTQSALPLQWSRPHSFFHPEGRKKKKSGSGQLNSGRPEHHMRAR